MMLRVVYGTYSRNMPFLELTARFAGHLPGGQTHKRHPNVLRLVKASTILEAQVSGERLEAHVGMALWRRIV